MKAPILIAVVLAAAVAGLTGATAAARSGATVSTATSKLGRILVDSRGRSLYLFEKDTRGRSACAGTCATYWPPLLTRGKPTVAGAAKQALLGIARRADGTRQVTYAGHPLYRFVQDTRPGRRAARTCTTSGPAGTSSRRQGGRSRETARR